jgi:hypothetical protein
MTTPVELELARETKRLKAELDAAVQHHERCRNMIDAALGEPRYDDGDIWQGFVRQIKELLARSACGDGERPLAERTECRPYDAVEHSLVQDAADDALTLVSIHKNEKPAKGAGE